MAGKHRKPARAYAATTLGIAGGLALMAAAPAHAAPDWDRLAQCESSGNWHINNGNGFYGGLQFHPATWAEYGGTAYAPSADLASREQQIEIAEKVLASQGNQAWPDCSNRVVPGWDTAGVPPPAPAYGVSSSAWPAQGTLTSTYGPRWGTFHHGIDIANVIGTPVLAARDGTVIEAGPASGFGQWMRVQHADGSVSVYGHVDSFVVTSGPVSAGQQIATMGNRGQSTGPHLHFEVRMPDGSSVDPQSWLGDPVQAPVPAPAPAVSTPVHDGLAQEYAVLQGDWLSTIAEDFGIEWRRLYEANADQIADPDLIFPGQVLRIP